MLNTTSQFNVRTSLYAISRARDFKIQASNLGLARQFLLKSNDLQVRPPASIVGQVVLAGRLKRGHLPQTPSK